MTTAICNPIDLPYRYQDTTVFGRRSVYREAADPSVVLFDDRYYLFASMSGGFWHSTDLASWEFRATPTLPIHDYAPDAAEVDGKLVVCASRRRGRCSFWRTTDPLTGEFQEVPFPFAFWDPALFQDPGGRVYLYWGCSNRTPIRGVELDRATLQPVGEPVDLIAGRPEIHGWERPGEDNDPARRGGSKLLARLLGPAPFVEGAWMTEHAGTYHLQYAAPGTEYNTYADGVYTAAHPLGPFTYAPDSPFSSKPGGFMTGAGHGSTFRDRHGNWWHAATMRISVNHSFERRIGLFPAAFDATGTLVCNQELADHPILVHERAFDPWAEASAGWSLLSHGRPVRASSSLPGHGPALAVDEDARTWWVAAEDSPGQWLSVDLGPGATVHAVQVNLADHDLAARKPRPPRDRAHRNGTGTARAIEVGDHACRMLLEASDDGVHWQVLDDTRDRVVDAPHRFVVLEAPRRVRHVRLTSFGVPWGGPTAVAGLRVFGVGEGGAPGVPGGVEVERTEERTARVTWQEADGADGYQVRWGREPDRLNHSWTVYGRTELDLAALSAGVTYWVSVDAFGPSGITRGEAVPMG